MSAHPALAYVGHATLRLDLAGIRILTDPVLRSRIGPLSRQAPPVPERAYQGTDVVLVSHLHHDHLDLPSLRRLAGRPRLIVPRGAGRLLRRVGLDGAVEVDVGDRVDLGGLVATAVEANHSGDRSPLGPRAPALGYVLDDGRRRIYFAGDTDLFDAMAALEAIDVALLPVGGWGPTLGPGHLDPERAAEAARRIGARLVVPIHWGTFWPRGLRRVREHLLTRPAVTFERLAHEVAPTVAVSATSAGDDVDLSAIW